MGRTLRPCQNIKAYGWRSEWEIMALGVVGV